MRLVGAVVMLALLAACGEGSSTNPPGSGPTEYVANGTVLESPEHGPQLCFAVQTSFPPQCGGLDIANWSWKRAPGEETANGTTWGDYVVHGTYADGTFTLTRTPTVPDDTATEPPPDDEALFATPCREPEEGWFPAGRPKIDDDDGLAVDRAATFAESLPGYSDLWLDQREDEQAQENDPNGIILNVRVTKGEAGARAAMRDVWPGALCVSRAKYSSQELQRIQEAAQKRAGKLTVGASSGYDRVDLDVFIDEDGALQKEFDEKYGKGVVRVTSALQPSSADM